MLKLGFDSRWLGKIMTCVRTVSFSVLVNGQAHGQITPSRGLKQGDLLSPYLLILCVEGLSNMLCRAEMQKNILGLPIIRGGVRLNHLFFCR